MKTRNKYTHVIDAVFPIAVFFVFTASSLVVLLLAARIYGETSSASTSHYNSRTAFAYVMEKVRQNDVSGGIHMETVDDTDCLALTRTSNDISITTYIYADDGMLRELRIRDGLSFLLSDGSDIAPVQSFEISESGTGLYDITLVDENGTTFSLTVTERSTP